MPKKMIIRTLLLFLPAVLSAAGCAWRVLPPPEPENPVRVYLTAYGLHSRLSLPKEGEPHRMIEYGFGDWDYYALQRTGFWSGFRALFFSRAAAFSRRELPFRDDTEDFLALAGGNRTAAFAVERSRMEALRDGLEARWRALDTSESALRARGGVELRKTDGRYHLFRNSNHRSAAWMRALGCRVRGPAISNRFRAE